MTRAVFLAGFSLAFAATPLQLGAQGAFPASWAGRWQGTLTTVAPPDSVRNRIPISLLIVKEDTGSAWTWRTVFNADTVRGLRDYRLLVRDAAKGHYATDERNDLVLESTFVDGTLVSVFQVGGRVLESRYALLGDSLVHDIMWWNATPMASQRGSGANAEAGAEVRSHRVEGRQRAVFRRAQMAR